MQNPSAIIFFTAKLAAAPLLIRFFALEMLRRQRVGQKNGVDNPLKLEFWDKDSDNWDSKS